MKKLIKFFKELWEANPFYIDRKIEQQIEDERQKLIDDGLKLREEAYNTPCKKCGKTYWALQKEYKRHLKGWHDMIDGEFRCTNCGAIKIERIQYPS